MGLLYLTALFDGALSGRYARVYTILNSLPNALFETSDTAHYVLIKYQQLVNL